MFKVNNKDTRTVPMAFWEFLVFLIWHYGNYFSTLFKIVKIYFPDQM